MGDLKADLKTDPPCHARACAIQNCIQRNNYNEEKCRKEVCTFVAFGFWRKLVAGIYALPLQAQSSRAAVMLADTTQVDALYECCNAFYNEKGEEASTVSCPKYSLLKLKMKQRAQESS
ncbi:hypothetical protein BKA66DRAFT_202824 [Pyrenochaeta sp. MPI-SDFR-AT-0127]|nr:hypothetical protein BKA66DRAFT_202824 [Pyrenochaeta sp. MPI-SDFR-AT-0127]